MAATRWLFTKSQLMNTPSRKNGIDSDKELSYRQQAANLIQDMGQRLQVTQLCINTAIVYMHRFYMFQSFTRFPRNEMGPASLFLAAKVEEQPRKLEHVIRVAHACLHRDNTPPPDPKSEGYSETAQTLVLNENILLQTLGFEITVDHPHTHVVKTCQLVKASKDLAQTSYFLATNSLHLTSFCLEYRPTIVACVCIHLACKWSSWEIPRSSEGKDWYYYIDRTTTLKLLEDLTAEFLGILEKCPSKLRKKIMGWKAGSREGQSSEVDAAMGVVQRRGKPEAGVSSSASHTSTTTSSSSGSGKPPVASSHHKPHTNHDRKEGTHTESKHHTHTASSHAAVKVEPHTKPSVKQEPGLQTAQVSALSRPAGDGSAAPSPVLTPGSDMKKSKSETSVVNYKTYMQRKEKERQTQHQQPHQHPASGSVNRTSSDSAERKQKYPRLDTSLPVDIQSSHNSVPPSHSRRSSQSKSAREEVPPLKLSLKQEPEASNSPSLHVKLDSNQKEVLKTHIQMKTESAIGVEPVRVSAQHEQLSQSSSKSQGKGPPGSHPPIKLHIKQDSGGAGTPKRLHIKDPVKSSSSHELHRDSNSPLKLKIRTSQINKGSESRHAERQHRHAAEHGGHGSGQERSSKHSQREKGSHSKPHKHSHAEMEAGTNGKALKLHIKMSDIKGHHTSSVSNDNRSHRSSSSQERHKHGQMSHNAIGRETAVLNVNANATGSQRQQPWCLSELIPEATSQVNNSPSRKRRRTPTVDQNSDKSEILKAAKTEPHRVKRSSSSHSLVDMDLSDSEPTLEATNGSGANPVHLQHQTKLLSIQLAQAIERQTKSLAHAIHQQQQGGTNSTMTRQQSLFDLDSYCYPTSDPPLPQDNPPPLPPSPAPGEQTVEPPPPPSV